MINETIIKAENLKVNKNDIKKFLDWHKNIDIWGKVDYSWYIRIRLLPEGKEYLILPGDTDILKQIIQKNEENKQNVYWVTGIYNPLNHPSGKNGCSTDADIEHRLFYLLDFDKESQKERGSLSEHLIPSLEVESSNRDGISRRQLFYGVSELGDKDKIIPANRVLAKICGADQKCVNDSRIMRLPGTINWKDSGNCVSKLIKALKVTKYSPDIILEATTEMGVSSEPEPHNQVNQVRPEWPDKQPEFIGYKDALLIASKVNGTFPPEAIGEGGRDNALQHWLGQMAYTSMSVSEMTENMTLLADKMCNPTYSVKGKIRNWKEQFLRYQDKHKQEQIDMLGALPEEVDTGSTGESELTAFHKVYAKELLRGDDNLLMFLRALTHFCNPDSGDEGLIVKCLDKCFKRLNCHYGQYYGRIIKEQNVWGMDVKYPIYNSREELLGLVGYALSQASKYLLINHKKVSQLLESQGNVGLIVEFKANNSFIERICKVMVRYRGISGNVLLPEQPDTWIVFQNGVFDVATGSFIGDKDAGLKYPSPLMVDYVEGEPQVGGLWSRYLDLAFGPRDRGSHEFIYRMFGLLGCRMVGLRTIFILQGESNCGKSTILHLLVECLGRHNTTRDTYSALGGVFSPPSLSKSLVCFFDEAESDDKRVHQKAGRWLKSVTDGGKDIVVEKKYSDRGVVSFFAKIVLLTNKGLEYEDTGGALMNRIQPLQFNNPIPADKIMVLEDVLSGLSEDVCAIMSSGARRFSLAYRTENKGQLFSGCNSKASAIAREELSASTSPLLGVVKDCMEIGGGEEDIIPSFVLPLLAAYLAPEFSRGKPIRGLETLMGDAMRRAFNNASSRARYKGKQCRIFRGVKLTSLDCIEYLSSQLRGWEKEMFLELYPFSEIEEN